MRTIKAFRVVGIAVFLSLISAIQSVFAAGATLGLSPNSGSYSSSFTVDVIADGGGQAFNAAQATVNISLNLSIRDLVLGNCNFSFLSTPGITNPSFAGVILGGSSKKCTVYSLTLVPTVKGTASISLSKASIKRFGDAANILSSVQNGDYTLTAATTVAIPTISPSQGNLYTVVLKILDTNNVPVKTTQVTLKPVGNNSPLQAKTDTSGAVQFTNVQPGIFTVTVTNYQGENVLNIGGNNRVLVLGVKLQAQNGLLKHLSSPIFIGMALVIGIIVGAIIFSLVGHFKQNRGSK